MSTQAVSHGHPKWKRNLTVYNKLLWKNKGPLTVTDDHLPVGGKWENVEFLIPPTRINRSHSHSYETSLEIPTPMKMSNIISPLVHCVCASLLFLFASCRRILIYVCASPSAQTEKLLTNQKSILLRIPHPTKFNWNWHMSRGRVADIINHTKFGNDWLKEYTIADVEFSCSVRMTCHL